MANSNPVVIASDQSGVPVTGTFWQATQPISGTVTASNTAGDIASGSADSGNPVKVGGVYNLTYPTYTDGNRANLGLDSRGNLRVTMVRSDTNNTERYLADNADATASSGTVQNLSVVNRNTVYNGTTWDRQYGDATNGAWVNIKSSVALSATQSGTWTVQPGNTANTTPWLTTITPGTGGGWSKIKYAAQTTTVQTVKGTAGTFGGYYVYNPNASVAYVQVFDVATGTTVTLGTTVPDMIFGIPATSGANLEIANGVNMSNGIKLACTTTATGSTAPGTGLDMTVLYK